MRLGGCDATLRTVSKRALFLSIVLALVVFQGPAQAEPWPDTGTGRIENTENGGTCSASLLLQDVVITAAHCLSPNKTTYLFRPGAPSIAANTYPIRRILRHPRYILDDPNLKRQRYDMAVALLDKAVPITKMRPIKVGKPPRVGETVVIESWRRDYGPKPRRRSCAVLQGADAFQVTLDCPVEKGESGAPVLRMGPTGPELVALVTARSQFQGQPVALAAQAELYHGLMEVLPVGR